MAINLNETIQKIKKAGVNNVRAVPMAGQNVNTGQYMIEIKEGNAWVPIVEGIPRVTADNIIQQATNRVICG